MKTGTTLWMGMTLVVLLLLTACGDKKSVTLPSDSTAVTLALVPDTATLQPGQTRQLVAVITGTSNQAANWSSNNLAIATVSATGLVTAGNTTGSAVITAVAQADERARDAALVTVFRPVNVAMPILLIQSVNVGGSQTAVDAGDVRGVIDVAARIDIPGGAVVKRVEFLVDNTVIADCTKNLEGAGAPAAGSSAQLSLPCSLNTAAYDTLTGNTLLSNGPRGLIVSAVLGNDSTGASARRDVHLNNPGFLLARVSASRTPAPSAPSPRSLAAAGMAWQGGSITVKVIPITFSRSPSDSLSEIAVTVGTSGVGVSGAAGCSPTGVSMPGIGNAPQDPTIALTDGGAGKPGSNSGNTPNCARVTAVLRDSNGADGFVVTFPDTTSLSNGGVAGVEDSLTFSINSTMKGGQAGPTCINPGPGNPLAGGASSATCGSGLGSTSPPNRVPVGGPWLHDNLAPRFTSLNIRREGAEPYFNNQTFVTSAGVAESDTILGAFTVDYGVGHQTEAGNTIFRAGFALNALAEFSNTNTLAESEDRYYFQAVVKDALGNTRVGTATNTRFVVADALAFVPEGSGSNIQVFGVDFTKPEITVEATTPADNSFTGNSSSPGTFTLTPADPGTGPSRFSIIPFRVKAELINGSGTVCYNLETGVTMNCSTGGGTFPSDGVFSLQSGVNGYWRITWVLADRARNETTPATRIRLVDGTFPSVGAIATPTSLVGGQSATFSAALTDNVELKDVAAAVSYVENAFVYSIEETGGALGAYGPEPLGSQGNASTTISSFLRSIESTSGGLPTGVIARATHFNYWVRDQLDNMTGQTIGILPAVSAGIGGSGLETSWRGAGRAFAASVNPVPSYQITSTPSNICVDSDGDGCTTPVSRTLTANVTGPALTFANPFARVNFYYRNATTGRLVLIGTGTASSSDNGATNTRTWTYRANFTAPTTFAAGNVFNVLAIGIDLAGRGLASGFVAITQTVD